MFINRCVILNSPGFQSCGEVLPTSQSQVLVNPTADMNHKFPVMFTEGSEVAKSITEVLKVCQDIKQKQQGADSKLLKETRWPGLKARLTTSGSASHSFFGIQSKDIGQDGHEPWLFTTRRNVARDTAAASPVAMVPCVIQSRSATIFVICIPAEKLLERGLSVTNYSKFLNTPEGAEFLREDCRLVRLQKHQGVYLPIGWLPQVLFLSFNKTAQWAHALHVPFSRKS